MGSKYDSGQKGTFLYYLRRLEIQRLQVNNLLKKKKVLLLSEDLPLSSTQRLIGYQEREKHEPAIERSRTFMTTSIQFFLSRQNAVKVTKVAFVHSVSF